MALSLHRKKGVDTTTQLMFSMLCDAASARGNHSRLFSAVHRQQSATCAGVAKSTKLESWCVPSIQQRSRRETLMCTTLSILGLCVSSLVVCRLWQGKLRRIGQLSAVEASLGCKLRQKEEYKVLPLLIRA
jgi:hypothetical protein